MNSDPNQNVTFRRMIVVFASWYAVAATNSPVPQADG